MSVPPAGSAASGSGVGGAEAKGMETSISLHPPPPPSPLSEQFPSLVDHHLHPHASLQPPSSPSPDLLRMDSSLQYISDMLMDENMEDRTCMKYECTAYQATVSGFYQILDDAGVPLHGFDCVTHHDCSLEERHSIIAANGVDVDYDEDDDDDEEDDEDYDWIDEVLVEEPSESAPSPWPWHHDSSTASSDQDRKGSSSSSSPFSQDSPTGISEESFKIDAAPAFPASQTTQNHNFMATLPPFTANGAIFEASHSLFFPSSGHSYGNQWPSENYSATTQQRHAFNPKSFSAKVQIEMQQGRAFPGRSPIETQQGLALPGHAQIGMQQQGVGLPGHTQMEMRQSRALTGQTQIEMLQGRALPGHTQMEMLQGRVLTGQMQIEMRQDPASPETARVEMHADAEEDSSVSFVKNKDLNAEKQARFYGDWSAADNLCLAKKKKKQQQQQKEAKGRKKGMVELVDLRALLVDCAQAIGANNLKKANEGVAELRRHVSPYGSAVQRLAYYFTEALVARLSGTGAKRYTEITVNRPSAANMLKAYKLFVEVCPFTSLAHCFANKNILQVASGASKLHIVDYGILYGIQWPSLISALSERKEGPPFLRITGIDFPQPGPNPTQRIEETGKRLAEYAKTYNVPFTYRAIAKTWEDIEATDLNLENDEILVVNCIHRLRHLLDETVATPCPRRKVLSTIRSLNPDVFVIAIMNASFNAPFFVSRFREALYHFSSKFDMIETVVGNSESRQRLILENECMGRDILNVVACEGPERIERPETHRQWHSRLQREGFEPMHLDKLVISRARQLISSCYHNDFSVDDDTKWMFLGWKGRIMEGLSAWRPAKS